MACRLQHVRLSELDDRAYPRDLCVGIADAGTARMPDERVDRLDRPARHDLSDIGEFQICLVIAWRRQLIAQIDPVLVEGTNLTGEARVDDAGAEFIVRPSPGHSREYDPAVDLDV